MSNFLETDDAPKTWQTPYLVTLDTDFSGLIENARDIDAIRFNVTEAGFYSISIAGREGGALRPLEAIKAAVLNSDGDTEAEFDGFLNDTDQLTFLAEPGDYLLRLGGESRFDKNKGDYTITANAIRFDETADAPSDDTTPYEVTDSASFSGTVTSDDREDWIRVELVEGQTYAFDLDRFGDWQYHPLGARVNLLNLKGKQADVFQLESLTQVLVFQAERTGTHYIQVKARPEHVGDNGYRLNMTDLMLDEIEDAPSEGVSNYQISAGESFTGALNTLGGEVSYADKIDIELEAGRTYRFSASSDSFPINDSLTQTLLELKNEAGSRVARSVEPGGGYGGGVPRHIQFTAQESGTYSLNVSGRGQGIYEVTTRELPNEQMFGEIVGDNTTQVALVENTTFFNIPTFFGTLSPAQDQDWFRVTLSAGTISYFQASGAGSSLASLDTVLTLHAADGSVLAQADDFNERLTGSVFKYSADADMEVFLAISSPGGLVSGDYQLTYRTQSADTKEIYGTSADDVLYLTGKRQIVEAQSGDDVVYGTRNVDTIYGGPGDDVLYGRGGRDHLISNGGSDQLFGGAGNDRLSVSGFNSDRVLANGGVGSDEFFFGNGFEEFAADSTSVEAFGGGGRDKFNINVSNSVDAIMTGGRGVDTYILRLEVDIYRDYEPEALLTITDFELGKDRFKLKKDFIVGSELEAHFRTFAQVDADGITIGLKHDSSVTFEGITDLEALIADTVLL